jgi:hypothetical protein
MPKLIISYRRSDSDAMAGRIRDNLIAYYLIAYYGRFDSDPRLGGKPFAGSSALLIERLTYGGR